MLKLHERDAEDFETGEILNDAVNVTEQRKLNDMSCLEFDYPMDDKARLIKENMLVTTNGRKYEILRVERTMDGRDIVHITAEDMFSRRAKKTFLPNIPDMIGAKISEVIDKALEIATKFSCFTKAELKELGMNRVGNDEFLIDFFSTDKLTLWEFLQTVLENLGRGELYSDGYKFAIVDRIGQDRGVRLALDKNMQNIKIERDTENLITRLHPFGSEDMHIGNISADDKPKGQQYIDSPNKSLYGIYEGYKDYSDYTAPDKILENARWEFDPKNEERIDIPQITITGRLIDLSKLEEYGDIEKVELGDTVHVYDVDGVEHVQRVIEGIWHPYEAETTTISIGHMRRDLFFTIYQLRHAKRQLEKVQTTNKGIATRKMQGTLNTDRNNVRSENNKLLLDGDLLYINDRSGKRRVNLGNVDEADEQDEKFVFELFNKLENKTLYVDAETGDAIFSGTIRGGKIESDTDINVNKDASVGQYLRVGYISSYVDDDGITHYEWYPESGIKIGPGVTIDTENKGNNAVIHAMGRIVLSAGSVTKNGEEIATKADLDDIKTAIQHWAIEKFQSKTE